jgi:hypothetical protein
VNTQRISESSDGVAVVGPLLFAIDLLQAKDRRAADFGIVMEQPGEVLELIAATPANVVRDDLDLSRTGGVFSQRCGPSCFEQMFIRRGKLK